MTDVVVDAAAVLALTLNEPKRDSVVAMLAFWAGAGVQAHAPALLAYEWTNGIARAVADQRFRLSDLSLAWDLFRELDITLHTPGDGFVATVEIAARLNRRSAYDAAYLALAAELGAELWTLDGPLYRNAVASGFDVRLFA